VVVRDSQAQALEQAKAAMSRQQDPRTVALWSTAIRDMENALARLNRATNSPETLKEALTAEQAAYQALLKLQEHEYQVARSRNRNQPSGGREQQMQRQLEQMDLTQSEDRYENQREAQRPQAPQLHEQLQVMNRLQELAKRQQDLNDRLKELQTALQEARTDEERAEIQRRLKRLQEEEQQALADVDELRQRMDRPENQSRMADQRRQLDQTREDVQRAAQAAAQGAASQALAAGTRAQRQLQQLHDEMRKENSSQFAEDLRQMRGQARELAQRQEEISRQMETNDASAHKSLSDAPNQPSLLQQLARQRDSLTNLVDHATEVSQQAENAEPLLSRQLYDTVRKFSQDTSKAVKESQEELLARGRMTRNLYDELKNGSQPDGAKLLDIASEMIRLESLPEASSVEQRARAGIDGLKRGVEHAAESVLGNDTEALRLAKQELEQLADQLAQEAARAQGRDSATNRQSSGEIAPADVENTNILAGVDARQRRTGRPSEAEAKERQGDVQGQQASSRTESQPQSSGQNGSADGQANQNGSQNAQASEQNVQAGERSQRNGNRASEQAGGGSQTGQNPAQPGDASREGTTADARRQRGNLTGGPRADEFNRTYGGDWNQIFNGHGWSGPLLGEDFVPWSDHLREVEEMIDQADLRNAVASARDRARLMRQEYKKERKKPDWAVVQLQIMKPLVEVRDRIADELARRDSKEALVPLDRDPVPSRYSELVRKYYEELGKSK
jgi:hypothetical protein